MKFIHSDSAGPQAALKKNHHSILPPLLEPTLKVIWLFMALWKSCLQHNKGGFCIVSVAKVEALPQIMSQTYSGNSVYACLRLFVYMYCLCIYVFSKNFVRSLNHQLATSRWFGQCTALKCLTERQLDLRSSSVRTMSTASGNWTAKSSVHLLYVTLKHISADILLSVVQFTFILTQPRLRFLSKR